MKYKTGDRVKIVNYGHQIWINEGEGEMPTVYDLRSYLVGKKATIVDCCLTQNIENYSLDIDDIGKMSWFGLKQLKKVWSWKNL